MQRVRNKSNPDSLNPAQRALHRGSKDGVIDRRGGDRSVHETVDAVYLSESRRVLATLIRLLGDFDVAEEALHEAFRAALEQWPRDGVPGQPARVAGLGRPVQGDRRHAPAGTVRRARRDAGDAAELAVATIRAAWADAESVEDDRLRLIFTCCHPALSADAQVALTLREVCGLTTEEIARAFLTPAPTLAQRIVRAKAKIRDARIPYQVPAPAELPERLDAVLRVIYLVFNEGYAASSGASLTRHDLSAEAIRLGRLLVELLPGAGSGRPAGADAAARVAPRGADIAVGRTDPARRPGSLAVEPRADRGGRRPRASRRSRRAASARTRCRRRSPPCTREAADAGSDRLGRDRRALRRAAAAGSVARSSS